MMNKIKNCIEFICDVITWFTVLMFIFIAIQIAVSVAYKVPVIGILALLFSVFTAISDRRKGK